MPKKISPCSVRVEDAAELMGMDAQTLRLSLQNGHYKDIGDAVKTTSERECWSYNISKFKLFQRLGLDVNMDVNEVLTLTRSGNPPFIRQFPLPVELFADLMDRIKKDAS